MVGGLDDELFAVRADVVTDAAVKLGRSSWNRGSMEVTRKLGCATVCAAIRRFPMVTKKSSLLRLKMVFHPPVVETWVLAAPSNGTT